MDVHAEQVENTKRLQISNKANTTSHDPGLLDVLNTVYRFRSKWLEVYLIVLSFEPARQQFGDLGPAVAEFLVRLVDDTIFLLRPGRLLYLRV